METLLAHSFDYLSSYEPSKVRKGLRQVEGLLAQICLSKSKQPVSDKRKSLLSFGAPPPVPKALCDLKDDPAFREFFKLQDGFQWNVALRLVTCLEHLLGRGTNGTNGTNDLLILSTLDLIQGVLLLHPPSRTLFVREIYMNLLLDLLDPVNCPAVQCATLLTLVTALLDNPANTRTFEELDGLLTVTSLFKQRSTSREVKLKLVEFLYFYLMPETPTYPMRPGASAPNTAVLGHHRSPSKMAATPYSRSLNVSASGHGGKGNGETRTTEEKQALLGRFLNNVEDLVEDLKETAPFGATVY
ncbi:cell division control protein 14 [Aspergillus clavatus NRRL 1]|uniref:Cell division control protein 14 n=1 Tax=Aspergillus clavatus (strain ATCC 1007 / CBS 513.65 / DSM 816 / NCTC 3887 / NRRL 1 / QM 1276 / 107) TaxID=344612 RepID=A1CPE5_ASPCL|nr:cell division control protein 14 [Aspergillus clavatus NRRL 1]EAW07516.1 cell division control protein 14 [Aspergillus clavatus NRRL 1]